MANGNIKKLEDFTVVTPLSRTAMDSTSVKVQYELPRQWIHTIGMLFSFDLVLIDKDHSWRRPSY